MVRLPGGAIPRVAGQSAVLVVILALSACAPAASKLTAAPPPCGDASGADAQVKSIAPTGTRDLQHRETACGSVGPVVLQNGAIPPLKAVAGDLFVVSWNVAIGSGRVDALVRQLLDDERRANRPEPDFILLLQEALRLERPTSTQPGGERHPVAAGHDVLSLATRLGMQVAYVPSMPNGGRRQGRVSDDRGNAILSTLPLRDVTAIELPRVRQRRVAVLADVDVDGSPLTVISVHLDTRGTLRQGSIFAGPFSRERQAAALAEATATQYFHPVIVAGDFNTIAGMREPALRAMEQHFARIDCGNPLTQEWGFALDHVFASDPSILDGCRRMDKRYGSDHHALVARVVRPLGRAGI